MEAIVLRLIGRRACTSNRATPQLPPSTPRGEEAGCVSGRTGTQRSSRCRPKRNWTFSSRDVPTSPLCHVGNAKRAYDLHEGRKTLVRYEDLRQDPLATLRRIYSELGISVEEVELIRAVKKHSWENIPEKEKGEGKFYRKATPGGWREDLTPEQAKMVEKITASLLEELYPSS